MKVWRKHKFSGGNKTLNRRKRNNFTAYSGNMPDAFIKTAWAGKRIL